MQVYVCVICKVNKPPLYVICSEHRRIFEAIVSSAVNVAKLKKCRLLACVDCQRLIQTVLMFQKTALVGVRHLLDLLSSVQGKPNPAHSTLQVKIKNELEEESSSDTKIEIEVDPERVETISRVRDDDLEDHVAAHCINKLVVPVQAHTMTPAPAGVVRIDKVPRQLATARHSTTQLAVTVTARGPAGAAGSGEGKGKRATPSTLNEPPDPPAWYVRVLEEHEVSAEREARRASPQYAEAALRCEPCVRTFASPTAMEAHAKLHLPSAGPFACSICSLRLATGQRLSVHRSQHAVRYHCCHCPYATPHKQMIEIHTCDPEQRHWQKPTPPRRRRYHNYPKPIKCKHCFAGFSHEYALDKHIARQHAEPPQPVDCKECGKNFKNIYLLKRHSYQHKYKGLENLHPERFCAECKIPFPTQSAYRNHLNSLKHCNKDDWKFQCDYCGRKCQNKTAITIHIKSVHTMERKFKCELCPRAFVSRCRLRAHARTHAPDSRPRPHVCDKCGKAFLDKMTLRQHMNIHNGLRPYKCKLCPATFSFSGAVYTHTKLKHLKIKKVWKKKGQKKKAENKEAESLDSEKS